MNSSRRTRWYSSAILLAAGFAVTGCSGDSGSQADASATIPVASSDSLADTTTGVEPLRVLVTNDDGVGADGIDAIVNALLELDDVEVTVVAPAENQSGTGGSTSQGSLVVTDTVTKSGYPAKAVAGFPADSIVWAIDQGGLGFVPDLVVSGINQGQNYSLEIAPLSGTVGAARAAATRNVPALAVSQGLGEPPDYPSAVRIAIEWIGANRSSLGARADGEPTPTFVSINVPTCATGTSLRGVVELPIGSLAGSDYNASNCESQVVPTNDVTAFQNGYGVITVLAVNGPPFTD